MYGNYKAIKVESQGSVLRVSIPKNADTDELAPFFSAVSQDDDVRVVVLTGSAERVFCVGGGGAGAPEDPAARNAYWRRGMRRARELILSMLNCDKPIVGRINGHAVGKGCSVALCCDITVVVDDAKIGDTHVKVGLVAGDGGSLLWPHLVGWMRAKRFLFTGDLISGKEAADIGLFTEASSRDQLDARTDYWIGRMVNAAPAALSMTKRAVNSAIRQQALAHMDMSLGLETLSFMTEHHREGVAAMLEKREPIFDGPK